MVTADEAPLDKLFAEKNASLEYKGQARLLKQIYALENRVFNANLQIPSLNSSIQHLNASVTRNDEEDDNGDGGEADQKAPLEIAITRQRKRIERLYLKYPYAPRKRINTSYLKALAKASSRRPTRRPPRCRSRQ